MVTFLELQNPKSTKHYVKSDSTKRVSNLIPIMLSTTTLHSNSVGRPTNVPITIYFLFHASYLKRKMPMKAKALILNKRLTRNLVAFNVRCRRTSKPETFSFSFKNKIVRARRTEPSFSYLSQFLGLCRFLFRFLY